MKDLAERGGKAKSSDVHILPAHIRKLQYLILGPRKTRHGRRALLFAVSVGFRCDFYHCACHLPTFGEGRRPQITQRGELVSGNSVTG